VGKVHCGENACVLVGRCGERTHIRTNDTLWGKCIVGNMRASELVVVGNVHTYVQMIHCGESALWGKSVRPSWLLWGTYTHTYQRYIVGKVHCGENACVLVGHCGERTHIRTNDTLWGKCVRPSWSLWGKYTHTYK